MVWRTTFVIVKIVRKWNSSVANGKEIGTTLLQMEKNWNYSVANGKEIETTLL